MRDGNGCRDGNYLCGQNPAERSGFLNGRAGLFLKKRRQVGGRARPEAEQPSGGPGRRKRKAGSFRKEEIQAVALAKWENFSRNGKSA